MESFTLPLVPIAALILIGYGLRRARFLADKAWAGMERLTYFVLFPALLIRVLGNQTLVGVPWLKMLLVVVGTVMICAAVVIIWHQLRMAVSGSTFTSIFQGSIRFNSYIALAVAQAFFGLEGLALAAAAIGFMVMLVNLLCISVFVIWGKATRLSGRSVVREVVGNPLILSCAVGWFLGLTGIGIPSMSEGVLELLGGAALPFGLLAVGAALKPEAVRGHYKAILVSSILQFGLKPLVAIFIISKTGLAGLAAGALIVIFMVPTAPSGYILARQLGGDTETMASIISFQTLLAFLVMPAIARVALL